MMKKITLLLSLVFITFVSYSQLDTFTMNYATYESEWAANNNAQSYNFLGGGYILNKNFGEFNRGGMNWLMTDFEKVGYPLVGGGFFEYPSTGFQLHLDSLDFIFYHTKTDAVQDTITIKIYDFATVARNADNIPTNPVTGTVLWEMDIVTDTALLGAGDFASRTNLTLSPNLALAPDQKFSVFMEYKGDTANFITPSWNFSNTCSQNEGAQLSRVPFNTNYQRQFKISNTTDLTGVWPSGIVFTTMPAACNLIDFQNWNISTFVRSTNTPSMAASLAYPNSFYNNAGCPGDIVEVSSGYIGLQEPVTYSWSPAYGLDDSTLLNPVLTLQDTSIEYVLTITDANNLVLTDTVNTFTLITTVNAGPDVTALCNVDAVIVPVSTTNAGGMSYTYSWNNGATGNLTTSTPGTYIVTSTNTAGCTATDDVIVTVTGENNVDFTVASGPICKGEAKTFTNASAKSAGWDFTWKLDGGVDKFGNSADYAILTDGTHTITLIADSSTCSYEETKNITVETCETAINESGIVNGLNISPNPTSNLLTVSFELNTNNNVEISLVSIDGKVLATQSFVNTSEVSATFNAANLSTGIYIVKVKTNEGISTRNIIVARK